jgi:predicted protein tyrosine phosphatase
VKIIVSSLARAPEIIASERPSHVVSLLSPQDIHLAVFDHAAERHLRLEMHDIGEGPFELGAVPPCAEHVAQLLSFSANWRGDEAILIHCWAGISRSTAAAFTLACARNPTVDEIAIAQALRRASVTAFPNPLIIAYADEALGRSGRMVEAIRTIGRPDDFEGTLPFHIPAVFSAPGS